MLSPTRRFFLMTEPTSAARSLVARLSCRAITADRRLPLPFASLAERSRAKSGHHQSNLQARSLTGDKCSAGASARKTFRREVESCFVLPQHGSNTRRQSQQSPLRSWCRLCSSLGCCTNVNIAAAQKEQLDRKSVV